MNDNTSSAASQHYARTYGGEQGAAGALTETPPGAGLISLDNYASVRG